MFFYFENHLQILYEIVSSENLHFNDYLFGHTYWQVSQANPGVVNILCADILFHCHKTSELFLDALASLVPLAVTD